MIEPSTTDNAADTDSTVIAAPVPADPAPTGPIEALIGFAEKVIELAKGKETLTAADIGVLAADFGALLEAIDAVIPNAAAKFWVGIAAKALDEIGKIL